MLHFVREKELNLQGTISRKRMPKYYYMESVIKMADLSKRIGYNYNIMKLVGYIENTRSLIDRAFRWKAYN